MFNGSVGPYVGKGRGEDSEQERGREISGHSVSQAYVLGDGQITWAKSKNSHSLFHVINSLLVARLRYFTIARTPGNGAICWRYKLLSLPIDEKSRSLHHIRKFWLEISFEISERRYGMGLEPSLYKSL